MDVTSFFKYQGTGNDFIMIDNRDEQFPSKDTTLIARLCDRKFGIGADGLILLQNHDLLDFTMVYFNADGQPSSMCGNGGRCIVRFAQQLGIVTDAATFMAVDGVHQATLTNDAVLLHMIDVSEVAVKEGYSYAHTGSPHHVQLTDNLAATDIFSIGRKLRYELYGAAGANINLVEPISDTTFKVRTYERGVEDETLSCGTGVTAVALAMHATGKTIANKVTLQTPGGNLQVAFKKTATGYHDIWLIGPATYVFKGSIAL